MPGICNEENNALANSEDYILHLQGPYTYDIITHVFAANLTSTECPEPNHMEEFSAEIP